MSDANIIISQGVVSFIKKKKLLDSKVNRGTQLDTIVCR